MTSLHQVGEWLIYKIVNEILRKNFSPPLYAVATNAQFQSCDQWKTTPNKLTLKFGVKSMSSGASVGLGCLGFTTA